MAHRGFLSERCFSEICIKSVTRLARNFVHIHFFAGSIFALLSMFSSASAVVALPEALIASERETAIREALLGSPFSADKLVHESLLVVFEPIAITWATISAENGSKAGVINLIELLLDKRGNESVTGGIGHLSFAVTRGRALFWLKQLPEDDRKRFVNYSDLLNRVEIDSLMNSEFIRYGRDICNKMISAVNGDPDASLVVYKYFLSKGESKDGLAVWLIFSAQNGSKKGQQIYSKFLSNRLDHESKLRARFWAARSINVDPH